ncbi:shikimate dehydrogenase [Candidatus Dojkabacteria bacterium CG_4_9_14_3_um_filter_150_Dojkabacteria_WS6_41_13]|nr:MAG: shikimate dehydrogenase [Candidatus Dojkabacteria bacterium CG_4_9_14_3_um_filter_150_Dojkabacteria_WS6_41_13]
MRNYQFPNQETKLCVTIGHPVNKQKSLFMHNAGYEALGINYLYLVRDIAPERLAEGLRALKEFGVAGISVSMPHKVEILKHLDVQTDAVKAIGACNTVHSVEGKLVGYNSDWIGAIDCLKKKITLRGKKTLVLGAGGAARAIVYGLKEEGARVTVLNRDLEKAKKLGQHFSVEWGSINDSTKYYDYDVIVNATSVGTRKSEECDCYLCRFLGLSVSSGEATGETLFLEDKIALDVVFQRNTTEFTEAATKRGHNVVYGHEMLVAQGAFQFKLFTGYEAPVEAMYAELKRNLEDW